MANAVLLFYSFNAKSAGSRPIVNISSTVGIIGYPLISGYVSSK